MLKKTYTNFLIKKTKSKMMLTSYQLMLLSNSRYCDGVAMEEQSKDIPTFNTC